MQPPPRRACAGGIPAADHSAAHRDRWRHCAPRSPVCWLAQPSPRTTPSRRAAVPPRPAVPWPAHDACSQRRPRCLGAAAGEVSASAGAGRAGRLTRWPCARAEFGGLGDWVPHALVHHLRLHRGAPAGAAGLRAAGARASCACSLRQHPAALWLGRLERRPLAGHLTEHRWVGGAGRSAEAPP